METKKYYHHITGLKGMACVLIMIEHYLGLYKYSQNFLPKIPFLDIIFDSRISFLLDEGYWLYLFFFLSGYLLSKTQVKTLTEVILKSINRFFRFAFPVFFSYLVIYLIYCLTGFHNVQTVALFECNWFQTCYLENYSFAHVLRSPVDVLLLGNCALNGPYWVLREMFAASIIIYILKYCYFILSKKNEAVCFSLLAAVTFAFMLVSPVVTACLLGMLISIYEDVEGILHKPYFSFWAIIIALSQYVFSGTYIFNVFFACLILFIPKVKFLDSVLSSKPVKFFGNISWGIYSFHWPLMCSLGAIFMIGLQPQIGLLGAYTLSFIASVLITVVVSAVFYVSFERLSSYLSSAIHSCLKRLMLGSSSANRG